MASLRDQLVHILDVDPPHGLMAWVRGSALGHAQAATRRREAEAVPVVEALLADPASSPRLRRQAVALLAHLLVVTAPRPTAEEIYSATRRGRPFDPFAQRRQAMVALVADADVEVGIAAAVELLEGADPGELPALRVQLARLLPLMRERRFDSPQVQQALATLGGVPDTLAWLDQLASQTGRLPPDLEVLLAALEREPHPAAAPRLRQIFTRLDAIVDRRDPAATPMAAGVASWDVETLQALRVLALVVTLAPADEAAAATALLALAPPALGVALIADVDLPGDRAAALAGAAAADPGLPAPVRTAAVARLARIAADPADAARMAAVAALQRLRDDDAVGAAASQALGATTVGQS